MSLSTMVTVEIEVEVFYTHTEDGLEVVSAICQYDLPRRCRNGQRIKLWINLRSVQCSEVSLMTLT